MKKATLSLFSVHPTFKVKFTTILESDPYGMKKEKTPAISKTIMEGHEYYNIYSNSFIVIDFSRKDNKNENYSKNYNFMMDRYMTFRLIQALKRLYRAFTDEKEMFFIDNRGEHVVNKPMAEKYAQNIMTCGGKVIHLQHCMCEFEGEMQKYEGIFLSVNDLSYYTFLTYDQIAFLIYELSRVDFNKLGLQLMEIAMNYEKKGKKITLPPVAEVKQEEIVDVKSSLSRPQQQSIPNI